MSSESPIWTAARHPLARLLREVAAGTFPPQDDSWIRVSPWTQAVQGIISFTRHVVMAVSYDVSDNDLTDLGVNGTGGATNPRVLTHLAGATGWIDTLDVLLIAAGAGAEGGGGRMVTRTDRNQDPMVEHARRVRQDVQVLGPSDPDDHDLVVLARGIAGVREVSFALAAQKRGRGLGAGLAADALACVPKDELVVACIAPGNAAALRSAMHAGFAPIGSVQLFSNRPERR